MKVKDIRGQVKDIEYEVKSKTCEAKDNLPNDLIITRKLDLSYLAFIGLIPHSTYQNIEFFKISNYNPTIRLIKFEWRQLC